jgi:hypothetical protein
VFGVRAEQVLNGGAAFRQLLAQASRRGAESSVDNAVAALAMGKLQYLNDAASGQGGGVARVRLGAIPAAFQRLVREGSRRLTGVVRKLGWRVVVCVDDTPLPPLAPTAAAANRFAPLALLGSREQPEDVPQQQAQRSEQPPTFSEADDDLPVAAGTRSRVQQRRERSQRKSSVVQQPRQQPDSSPVAAGTRSKVQQRQERSQRESPAVQQPAQQPDSSPVPADLPVAAGTRSQMQQRRARSQSESPQQPDGAPAAGELLEQSPEQREESPVEGAGAPQPELITLRGLPKGATVVCWPTGRYTRWGAARRLPGSSICAVSLANHAVLGQTAAFQASVAEVARYQAYAWGEMPVARHSLIRSIAILQAHVAGAPTAPTTTDPCPSLFPVQGGQLVCKSFPQAGKKPVWGVVSLLPDASPPYIWQVAYVDDDTETMTTREVLRHQQAMPAQVEAALLPRLYQLGATDVPHPDSLARGLPVAGSAVLIRKVYAGRPCIGVATLRPRARAPYVYKVAYPADGDAETMDAAEVGEHRVGAAGVVPVPLLSALARLCCAPPAQEAEQGVEQGTAGGAPARRAGPLTPEQRQRRAAARRRRRWRAGLVRAAARDQVQGRVKVACVNVCGLSQQKAGELHTLMCAEGVDVLGVCESWEGRCSPTQLPGYAWVGRARAGGQGGGVGFYVSRSLLPNSRAHADGSCSESLWLELRSGACLPLFLGLVYLPPSCLANTTAVTATFAALQADVQRFQQLGTVAVLGDLNSVVGRAQQPGRHVGEYGEDRQPDAAGARLLELLRDTNLYTLNGRCACPTPEFTRRRNGSQAVLDYVLAPKAWAVPVPPAVAPRSALEVRAVERLSNTDHAVLLFSAPHNMQEQQPQRRTVERANIHLLTQPKAPGLAMGVHEEQYQQALQQALTGYDQTVQRCRQQAAAGGSTQAALRACEQAKAELVDGIYQAVGASLGFKAPRALPGNRKPPMYTSAVRRAVAARNRAAAAVPAAAAALTRAQAALRMAVAAARAEARRSAVQQVFDSKAARDDKKMWAALAALEGRRAPTSGPAALRAPGQGQALVVDPQGVADVLAEHYCRVSTAAARDSSAFDEAHRQRVEQDVLGYRQQLSHVDEGSAQLSATITEEEVAACCHKLENGKAASPLAGQAVPNELLKFGGAALHTALATFFNLQFELETKARTPGVITPLYKKGDPADPGNYRPITLGSVVDKLYNLVLNARILAHLEGPDGLHEAHHGFRPDRGTVDNLFVLRAVIDARLQAKQDTFLLFLDIQKAFDSVWRAGLLWQAWQKGLRGRLFRVLAQMLDSTPCMVQHGAALSSPVYPDLGTEQGDPLSPTLFNLFSNAVLESVHAECAGIPVPGVHPQGADRVVALAYADDLAGVAVDEPGLQALADSVRSHLHKWRLAASVDPSDASKTAVMRVRPGQRRRQPMQPVQWGGVTVPQVGKYRYLGVQVTDDGKWEEHLSYRTGLADGKARACLPVVKDRSLPVRVRKHVLCMRAQPALLYASAVWGRHTQQQRRRLDGWQGGWVGRAFHAPATVTQVCLQQELGLAPAHVWAQMALLRFWHRANTLPATRLVAAVAHAVATAWRKASPWQSSVQALLAQYGIDAEAALASERGAFSSMLATKAAAYMQQHWSSPAMRGAGVVAQRYLDAFGVGEVAGGRAAPRRYTLLTEGGPSARVGLGVQVCMQLRVECLGLRAAHGQDRRGESAAARAQREQCPCCHAAPETPAHFLFECPATAALRREFFFAMQESKAESPVLGRPVRARAATAAGEPLLLEHFRAGSAWRRLLSDDYLDDGTTGALVVGYAAAIWSTRRAALAGREADGREPAVSAPVPSQDDAG